MDLRVLLVTSEFPPDVGGIGSHVVELARGLSSEIKSVTVVHPQGLASRAPDSPAVDFNGRLELPHVIKAEPFYQLMTRRCLARMISGNAFDLAHVHGMRPLGATRRLAVPTVFTNHSSGFLERLYASPLRKALTTLELQHVKHLIGPSDELVEAARTLGYTGPASMIPNAVDPDRFSPGGSSIRAGLGIDPNEIVILLARRLAEKNGTIWFARAIALLRDLKFKVLIAGDGEEREPMRAILREADMLERTIFLGSVPNTAMPEIYRAADLSVLPSLAEATSIAGLEAMATELPLVGTRVGGIPMIIEENVTGLLVPPRDPEAMGVALRRLVCDAELRRRMGAAARERVEKEFTWPQVVRRTIDVYRSSVGAARA